MSRIGRRGMNAPAFDGVRVLDLSSGAAGGFCGRLLALFGADVIRVSADRPFGADPLGAAALELHLHARKRLVALGDGRAADVAELFGSVDIVVEDGLAAADPASALRAEDRLVVVSFSPYGLSGPKAGWPASELSELAAGGWLTSKDGAEPLMPGSSAAHYGVGAIGALGAALALAERRRSGRGQIVEVAANEALLSLLAFPTTLFAFLGRDTVRIGDGHPFGIYRCADGHIGVSVLTQRHWSALCELMERPDLLADPRFANGDLRALPEAAVRLDEIIAAWAADRPALDTFERGQAMRVPISMIPSPLQVLASRHYAERDYWQQHSDPEIGLLRLADRPFRSSEPGMFAPFRPAPVWSAARSLESELSASRVGRDRRAEPSPRAVVDEHRSVLDGVRILDLTAWQAGPLVTMILGDFGAEVLKIESASRLDGWRGSSGLMEDRAYERSPIWLAINRSKLGLSLDLATPQGKELFLRLVRQSDVVVENFTPRVMANFGLSYDVLRQANERIVMIALSGFGASGPWRDFSAFAFPTEQVSGITWLNGPTGGSPEAVGQPVTDALAGVTGALAVLAALARRERTGHGEFIDLAQIETLSTLIGPELIEAQARGSDPPRRGNDRPGLAVNGVFPCRPEGDWVAISAGSEEQLASLAALVGVSGLAEAGGSARVALSAWTSQLSAEEVTQQLIARGIAASPVMRPSLLMADEQLWARDFFWLQQRAEVDDNFLPGAVVRLHRTPGGPQRPAPLFGEHTDDVLRRLLGLTDSELQNLRASGVTATTPRPQHWR